MLTHVHMHIPIHAHPKNRRFKYFLNFLQFRIQNFSHLKNTAISSDYTTCIKASMVVLIIQKNFMNKSTEIKKIQISLNHKYTNKTGSTILQVLRFYLISTQSTGLVTKQDAKGRSKAVSRATTFYVFTTCTHTMYMLILCTHAI